MERGYPPFSVNPRIAPRGIADKASLYVQYNPKLIKERKKGLNCAKVGSPTKGRVVQLKHSLCTGYKLGVIGSELRVRKSAGPERIWRYKNENNVHSRYMAEYDRKMIKVGIARNERPSIINSHNLQMM